MKIGRDRGADFYRFLVIIALTVGCSVPARNTHVPGETPKSSFSQLPAALAESPAEAVDVVVLYPNEDSELEMGQIIKLSIQVTDAQGSPVSDARVSTKVYEPMGETIAEIAAFHRAEGIYLTDSWAVPHHAIGGAWNMLVNVETDDANGKCSSSFEVLYSTSDILRNKYGFWLDEPDLRGLTKPHLYAERGDAQNGMIRWGGTIPTGYLHFWPARYVDVHWREGDFVLEDHHAVERFVSEEIGDTWFSPVRRILSIEPIQFKQWNAWMVKFQTRFPKEEMEGVIFYAPEVDKTYAIVTLILLPSNHQPLHESLRSSFTVFQDADVSGVGVEPLVKLHPAPELIGPPLAAHFQGLDQPIVLQWKPMMDLAEDEYYEVTLDYWYKETNPSVKLVTRQDHITVPQSLYDVPNCSVFNWQVALMRRIGQGRNEYPIGEPISYKSQYWYFWWEYPAGERPFPPACPYTHVD